MLERTDWENAWDGLAVCAPAGLLAQLVACYSEPHRAYHTLQHLRECFLHLESASSLAARLSEVQLGLWFHDAVYDTRAQDNEERSAAWARESLRAAGASSEAVERVHRLVMATRHDAVPEEPDARLLVDIDLSILGAGDERFAEYEKQIRAEYSWVPETAYRQARTRVLASFLERPSIYSTPRFRGLLEQRARRNLSRSLEELNDRARDTRNDRSRE